MSNGLELEACVIISERIRLWLEDSINSGMLTGTLNEGVGQILNDTNITSIPFSVLKSIFDFYNKDFCLNELLHGSDILYPREPSRERDPVLEARIQKLRAQQEFDEYNNMVKGVAAKTPCDKEYSFGHQYKLLNRQLFMMINFVLTVACVFIFGYKASEYYLGYPNLPLQLMTGIVFGTIVFVADLYFILRNEL